MCLWILWTEEQTKKWLEDKPDTITAYKAVLEKFNERIYPLFYSSTGRYYKRNTKTTKNTVGTTTLKENKHYIPYYHLCLTEKSAKIWAGCSSIFFPRRIMLKCEIPKDKITAMGRQHGCIVIVTKEFTFVKGDEFFEEEKE